MSCLTGGTCHLCSTKVMTTYYLLWFLHWSREGCVWNREDSTITCEAAELVEDQVQFRFSSKFLFFHLSKNQTTHQEQFYSDLIFLLYFNYNNLALSFFSSPLSCMHIQTNTDKHQQTHVHTHMNTQPNLRILTIIQTLKCNLLSIRYLGDREIIRPCYT